jgi:putative transposase
VQKETYLLELARYIVLNPVWAPWCARQILAEEQSYRDTAGLRQEQDWLTTECVLAAFGKRKSSSQQ